MAHVMTGQERLNWFIRDDMRVTIDAEMERLQPDILPVFDESTITRNKAFEMVRPIVKILSINYLGVAEFSRGNIRDSTETRGLPNVGIAHGAGMILDVLAPVESKHGDIWPVDEPINRDAWGDIIPSPTQNPAYLSALLTPGSGIGRPEEIVADLQLNWSRWIIQYSSVRAREIQSQDLD